MKILVCFQPIFNFELKGKRSRAEPSRAELKILQLELRLEPARLGLITSKYTVQPTVVCSQPSCVYTQILAIKKPIFFTFSGSNFYFFFFCKKRNYAFFQCGSYSVFKKRIKFFEPKKVKKTGFLGLKFEWNLSVNT